MKVYVAGPMTGIEDFNYPAFHDAEKQLVAAGHTVLNPARHGFGRGTWADYMRLGLADVLTVDGVALLRGWQSSRGAQLEVTVAEGLRLDVRMLEDWLA